MTAIFAIANTAWAVVKMRPEKKVQVSTGFEPMTSAIPAHCSTNWANKPTGSWSLCWYQINSYFHYCSGIVHYCLSIVHSCKDLNHIHVFICSSYIWLSYIHSRLNSSWLLISLPQWFFCDELFDSQSAIPPTICHNINQLWSVWFNITIIPDNMRNVCVDMYLYTCKIDQSPPTGLISGPTWTIWSQIYRE